MEMLFDFLKEHVKNAGGFMKSIPFDVEVIQTGFVQAKIIATEELCNPLGTLHGGYIFSVVDSVGGVAAMTHGSYVTTTCGNIHYLNSTKKTTKLWIRAKEMKAGRKILTYDVDVMDETENLICKATMEYYVLQKIEL